MKRNYLLFIYILIGAVIAGSIIYFSLFKKTETMQTKQAETASTLTPSKVASPQNTPFPILERKDLTGKKASITTDKGNILIDLNPNTPLATSNFIALARKGFYDNLTFHRREEGFVIQGGDPAGNGTGGPGYKFADEPFTGQYTRGTVAMANAGPNTNGSQFFIVLEDQPTLPKAYTIFGTVTVGMDVADKIMVGDVMKTVTLE
ncbi:MAG: peptidylprolyl isomerase [Candidatus Curtissbacteria bacterium]